MGWYTMRITIEGLPNSFTKKSRKYAIKGISYLLSDPVLGIKVGQNEDITITLSKTGTNEGEKL